MIRICLSEVGQNRFRASLPVGDRKLPGATLPCTDYPRNAYVPRSIAPNKANVRQDKLGKEDVHG